MSALDLFRMGFNTIEIAAALGKSEFEVERLIHTERSQQINDYKRLRQARRYGKHDRRYQNGNNARYQSK